MVRITTWNVNGIRNPFGYQPWRENRAFNAMFDILEADIVVMQELKIQRKDLRDDMVLVPGWDCYFSLPKHKKGYSGVGIYTRQSVCAPIRAEEGLLGVLSPPGSSTCYRDLPDGACVGGYPSALQVAELDVDPAALDAEGRCVVLEFPAFVLFGVYSPANSNGQRDDFRFGFICALDTRIRNLHRMGKRVILTGDLNVSREEIDTAAAEENMLKDGITREAYFNSPNRRVFNQLLENGKVLGVRDEMREKPVLYDLCREFHPKREGMFTHWEQKINARPGNFGSRIDYVLCSTEMKNWFVEANIQEGLMGSDHCPVYAATKDRVDSRGEQVFILDILNPEGMFKDGKRLRKFDPVKDLLPMSGKLLPEFDKRRSIKDMFARKPSVGIANAVSNKTTSAQMSKATRMSSGVTATSGTNNTLDLSSTQPSRAISPIKSAEKRRSTASPPSKILKRKRPTTSSSSSQTLANGQQSLAVFFRTKSALSEAYPEIKELMPTPEYGTAKAPPNMNPQTTNSPSIGVSSHIGNDITDRPTSPSPEPMRVIDAQASKESWVKLFSKKPPPRCEGHAEPCISLTTKKPGVNCGRQFWICPRPIGPSGQKEIGTQWRCGTFIWASDWNAPSSTAEVQ
ncbi:Endonuclease/exonuclease/phosphatase [Lophiotrema nucula]|uniref:DNA-(apurinic or apyrimidinic site) endonuclease 2 n=1 Tax=Lophiotrema nucula TaxID=690887 RepID=A0A6A5YFB5_9PLEO|nr:Endonuclease/exonuclease/phosphatase [Lophiotrema nucula]